MGNSFYHLLKQFAHFCYSKLIEPKSVNEDSKRREFILNFILIGSIVLLSVLDLFILRNSIVEGEYYSGVPFLKFSIIPLIFVSLLFLSRKRYFLISSYILIALYYAAITYSSYNWGVSLPANLLGYALIIIISSILISNRFSFIVAIVISITLISFGYFEAKSVVLPLWKTQQIRTVDSIEYSFILLLIMAVSWLSNREIEKSLKRARYSENELRQERDSLEVKVEDRTKELRKAQIDKISQLYRFAELGKISSGLFHDLINPLTSLSLNVTKIKSMSDFDAPEITKHLNSAIASTKKMGDLIMAIRKQIQNQEILVDYDLAEELNQVVSLLSYKAKVADVQLVLKISGEFKMRGNPLKFDQIVLNLISNAIDSYEDRREGGKNREIIISLTKDGGMINLKVKDNGSGIDPHILPNIFDPLFTTKSPEKGTGLGLSITKSIVEKDFNGTIKVDSNLNEGSTFTVIFEFHGEKD